MTILALILESELKVFDGALGGLFRTE